MRDNCSISIIMIMFIISNSSSSSVIIIIIIISSSSARIIIRPGEEVKEQLGDPLVAEHVPAVGHLGQKLNE